MSRYPVLYSMTWKRSPRSKADTTKLRPTRLSRAAEDAGFEGIYQIQKCTERERSSNACKINPSFTGTSSLREHCQPQQLHFLYVCDCHLVHVVGITIIVDFTGIKSNLATAMVASSHTSSHHEPPERLCSMLALIQWPNGKYIQNSKEQTASASAINPVSLQTESSLNSYHSPQHSGLAHPNSPIFAMRTASTSPFPLFSYRAQPILQRFAPSEP